MPSQAPLSKKVKARCRNLRQQPTEAEQKLWLYLRDRRLDGIKFRRQHPVGQYIVDFYCQEARLCIEIDGSEHLEPIQSQYDLRRTQYLETQGMHVIRFLNNDVMARTNLVLDEILNTVHSLLQSHPE